MTIPYKFNPFGISNNTPIPGSRGVFVSSGAAEVISAMTVSGISLNNDAGAVGEKMDVYRKGKAYDIGVDNHGVLRVYSGGLVSGASVTTSGMCTVRAGGQLSSVVISASQNSATLYISGAVVDCTVNTRGLVVIRDDGFVSRSTLLGGTMDVSGGTLSDTTMSGGYCNISAGGKAYLIDMVTGSPNCTIWGYAYMPRVSKGFLTLSGGSIRNGLVKNANTNVYIRGGTASSMTVSSGGSMSISSGGVVVGGSQVDGYVHVFNGGIISAFSGGPRISSGGHGNNLFVTSKSTARLFSGGSFDTATINNGGILQISGGTGNEVVILSGGTLTVFSGGAAYNVVSSAGARVDSKSGAIVEYK